MRRGAGTVTPRIGRRNSFEEQRKIRDSRPPVERGPMKESGAPLAPPGPTSHPGAFAFRRRGRGEHGAARRFVREMTDRADAGAYHGTILPGGRADSARPRRAGFPRPEV